MRVMKSLFGLAPLALLASHSTLMAQVADELAYNGEIGRIINENCVVCHQDGGIGPMQFETYDQIRPWAPLIQYKVANREMPPYAYDQHIGVQDLIGDWRMKQDDIDKIVAWVNARLTIRRPRESSPATRFERSQRVELCRGFGSTRFDSTFCVHGHSCQWQ